MDTPRFPHLVLLMFASTLTAQASFPKAYCGSTGNFTANSTYQTTLTTLLSSISTHNSWSFTYGFFNASAAVAGASQSLYVVGSCRGDLTGKSCRACLNTSAFDIRRLCPLQKEAVLYNENCTIRYSNISIFGVPVIKPIYVLYNMNNVSREVTLTLGTHFKSLWNEAAGGGSLRKYATRSISSRGDIISAMAQCTLDLTEQQCIDCLEKVVRSVRQDYIGKRGMRTMAPSCQFRYETNDLFFDLVGEPLLPPPSSATVTVATSLPPANLRTVKLQSCSSPPPPPLPPSPLPSPPPPSPPPLLPPPSAQSPLPLPSPSPPLSPSPSLPPPPSLPSPSPPLPSSSPSSLPSPLPSPSPPLSPSPSLPPPPLPPLPPSLPSPSPPPPSLSPSSLPSPSPAPLPPSPPGKSNKSKVAIFITVSVGVVMVLLFITCYLLRRKGKRTYGLVKGKNGTNELTTVESLQFDLATIQAATNDFSPENKLGEGGFGEVFQGTLRNGQEIAVKRLSQSSRQGDEEFKNEVLLVAKLQHRNLVRLLGFCLEEDERLLTYEFVPNKSLDYFLFDPQKSIQLNWPLRHKIIYGIARGILYLHEDSRLRIIHRDLKCSNILLDTEMNPKISDFGMARIFGVDQTQASTNKIVGTIGYMSPEYAMHGKFSVKSDVYSFGILLLEIICGKKNNFYDQLDGSGHLAGDAWNHWREGTPLKVLDPTIVDSYSIDEVLRCLHICLLCIQEDPAIRPTMATVVLMLNSNYFNPPSPQHPAFFVRSQSRGLNIPMTELEADKCPTSTNGLSITELYPR